MARVAARSDANEDRVVGAQELTHNRKRRGTIPSRAVSSFQMLSDDLEIDRLGPFLVRFDVEVDALAFVKAP